MIKILLADDYPLIREILKEYFTLNYPEIQVVGEAQNGEEAVGLCQDLKPDYVIMDIKMPIMDGITATGKIKNHSPSTKVICYTGYRHEILEHKALAAGASAFFLKPFDLQDIAGIIMQIDKGEFDLYQVN